MDDVVFTSVVRPIPVAQLSVDSTTSSYAEMCVIDDYVQLDAVEPPRTRNPGPRDTGSFSSAVFYHAPLEEFV